MRRGAFAALAILVLVLLLAAVPSGARAGAGDPGVIKAEKDEEIVSVEVRVIRASNEGTEVDSLLQDLRDRFARFSWKSYKLVDSRILRLGPDGEGTVPLPNGDVFRLHGVTFGDGRVRMTVGTEDVVLKVSLADDGTVVVGGLKEGGGETELMVAVTASF